MSDAKTSDAKAAKASQEQGWDGEADPVLPHGADWFWGEDGPPPAATEQQAKAASKTAPAKS